MAKTIAGDIRIDIKYIRHRAVKVGAYSYPKMARAGWRPVLRKWHRVAIHNAGRMSSGRAEAFTPMQFADAPPSGGAAGRDAREGCGAGRRGDARPGLRERLHG